MGGVGKSRQKEVAKNDQNCKTNGIKRCTKRRDGEEGGGGRGRGKKNLGFFLGFFWGFFLVFFWVWIAHLVVQIPRLPLLALPQPPLLLELEDPPTRAQSGDGTVHVTREDEDAKGGLEEGVVEGEDGGEGVAVGVVEDRSVKGGGGGICVPL